MKISPIMRKITLGALALTATACKECRGPIQKVAKPEINEIISFLNRSDSIVLKDTTYKLLGRDTVQLPANFSENILGFKQDLQSAANKKVTKVLTGSHETSTVGWISGDIQKHEVLEYTDKFIQPKAIIKNEIFQNGSGEVFFVPVEFYAKKNPDPKLKGFVK